MKSASAALLPVNPVLGWVLAVLLAVAVVVTARARLSPDQGFGRGREVLTAEARAAAQLAASDSWSPVWIRPVPSAWSLCPARSSACFWAERTR